MIAIAIVVWFLIGAFVGFVAGAVTLSVLSMAGKDDVPPRLGARS